MYDIYEDRRTATKNALALIESMAEPYKIEGCTIVGIGVHEGGVVYGLGRSENGCGCIMHGLKRDADGMGWAFGSYDSEFQRADERFRHGTLVLWTEECEPPREGFPAQTSKRDGRNMDDAPAFMADEYGRMAESGATEGSPDSGILVRDGRGCKVYAMDEDARAIVLAEDRSWDGRTFLLGKGLRLHVHEWEGAEAEDWEPDADGYVPTGYVYASLDVQEEDGSWTEDADGAVIGYGPAKTLGEWVDEAFTTPKQ